MNTILLSREKTVHNNSFFFISSECPLVLYVFSKSKKVQDLLVDQIRCGSVCINDTIMQFSGEFVLHAYQLGVEIFLVII